jgi:hypothetical protein
MEVGDIYREDSDMVKVEMIEREHEDVMLVRYWSGEALVSSSGMRGACEVRVFRRSHHICKLGYQLFDMA